ncbi:MAG: hypothetical protein ACPG7F_21205 [Aggregatilineales bacterium]
MDDQQQILELARYVDMLRNLRYDIKRSISYEMFNNTGRLAYRSYNAIQQGLLTILDDEFVRALTIEMNESMTEKELIWLVNMAAGQLMSYTEGLLKMQKIQFQIKHASADDDAQEMLRWVMRDDD